MARSAAAAAAPLLLVLQLLAGQQPGSGSASTPPRTSADASPTRIRHISTAMRLLIDQCEGRAPLTQYGDMKLPCAGRDLMDGALGALDISNGTDTETCMRWLRNPAAGSPTSFNGQPWPAIWYTYGHRFNSSDKAWLFDRMNASASATVTNPANSRAARPSKAAAGDPGTDVSYNNMCVYSERYLRRNSPQLPLIAV
jgi:hypothetical protein